MEHKLQEHGEGLHYCTVCGGAEGSLPTDCPGVRMTAEQEEAVYHGRLNYAMRQWWVPLSALELACFGDKAKVAFYLAAAQDDASGVQPSPDWQNFPSYLLDKCELETITEESLQRWVAAFLRDPQYASGVNETSDAARQQGNGGVER